MLEIIQKNNTVEAESIKVVVDDFCKTHSIPSTSIIELHFVSSDKIQALNNKYLGINQVTDVLSFPQSKIPGTNSILGTIFIGENEIKFGIKHIIDLVIHGLFHLIGLDHQTNPTEWRSANKKYYETA